MKETIDINFVHQPLDRSYTITSSYGVKRSDGKVHTGIDLDVNDHDPANIYAVNSGTVIVSGYNAGGYGYYTVINHGGYCTLYAHMKQNYYRTGQQVSAGTVLGPMGSTGNSTGDHLHLELRVGDASNYEQYRKLTKLNPATYLSGGSYPIPKVSDYSSSPVYSPSTIYTDMSGRVLAETISSITSQPIHAFVKIYLGDDLILLSSDPPKPNIFQSFEYTRYEGVGEEASFTLFDTNWDDIEYYLSKNYDRVYIQYGYPGTSINYPIRRHRLSDYSISMTSTGTLLTVSTITEGAYQNLKQTTVSLDDSTNRYNPTEFVKSVCQAMGWIVEDENFDESSDISGEPLNIINDYPVTYILNTVVPLASQQNEESFYFYLDSSNKAYFKRYPRGSSRDIRTYVYQRGYNSPVIDLSFDIKGIFGGTSVGLVATGLRGSIIDPTSKDQQDYRLDSNDVRNLAYGESSNTQSNQSIPSIDVSGDNADRASRKLYYYLKSSIDSQYTANMTIVGDPTINLFEDVRIINITDSGNLHHTSGVYWVKGITDSVTDGTLRTTLELARNATAGLDGIELINPRSVIK